VNSHSSEPAQIADTAAFHLPPLTLRRGLAAAALIVWLFLVIAAYYAVHKPFGLPQLAGIGQAMLDLGLWLGTLVIAAGWGWRLAGRWPDTAPVERLVFGLGLGLAALGYSVMALGFAGLLRPLGMIVLGAGLLLWQVLRPQSLVAAWQAARSAVARPRGHFEWLMAGAALSSLALTLIWALAPPYAFDAAVYHLRQVSLYLAEHSIFVPVDSAYAGFPGLWQMLFAFSAALGGDSAAQLVHFTCLTLTVLAAAALGRRLWSVDLTWPLAALLTAVPTLLLVAAWPYVDVALAFYTLLLCYALVVWLQTGGTARWLVLAALMCGTAMEIKYTALWYPLAGAALILLRARRDGLRSTLHLALFAAVTAVVAAPWYVRNWLLTGNPVYPYVWGGPLWDAGRTLWWDRPGTGLIGEPWRLLTAPWEMTIFGSEGLAGYQATLGPLLLVLVPGLLVLWPRLSSTERCGLGWLGLFGGVLYAVWLWGIARSALLVQSRLLLPVFPLLALAAALVLQRLRGMDTRVLSVSWLVKAGVALVLAFNLVTLTSRFARDNPPAALLGVESRFDYVGRRVGTAYAAALDQVNALPPGAQILFLWEPRTYHCRRACLPDSLYDNLVYLVRQHGSAAGLAEALAAQGVTHVLLNRQVMETAVAEGSDPIGDGDLAIWHELQADYLRPVYDDGVMYALYAVVRQ
jgi:4-amino-4-deoxy-L-arabinose transferase-like glycosyltransferase